MPPLAQILLAITPMRSLSGSNGVPQDRPKKGYSLLAALFANLATARRNRLCASKSFAYSTQIYRLLDEENTRKSLDRIFELLSVLQCRIDIRSIDGQANGAKTAKPTLQLTVHT